MADGPKYPDDAPTTPHPRASKDDHKGATAAGLYYLAEDFLRAAKLTAADSRSLTDGPPRLLALHACELFLKAYLRHAGHDLDALRAEAHNLARLQELAATAGLQLSASTIDGLNRATDLAEHNRARYVVVQRRGELSAKRAIAMATELHRRVAKVLGTEMFASV